MNRKNILQSIGTVVGTGSVTGIASSQPLSSAEIERANDVIEVDEVDNVAGEINRLKKDSNFQSLVKEHRNEGWEVAVSESSVLNVQNTEKNLQYKFVLIGFEQSAKRNRRRITSEEELYVTWTDVPISKLTSEANDGEPEVSAASADPRSNQSAFTSYKISQAENEHPVVESTSITSAGETATTRSVFEPPSSAVSAQSDCNTCQCPQVTCDSYNWSCILQVAGGYVTVIGACGSCAVGSPTCLVCVGAVLTSAGLTIGCDVGVNCQTEVVCGDYCCA